MPRRWQHAQQRRGVSGRWIPLRQAGRARQLPCRTCFVFCSSAEPTSQAAARRTMRELSGGSPSYTTIGSKVRASRPSDRARFGINPHLRKQLGVPKRLEDRPVKLTFEIELAHRAVSSSARGSAGARGTAVGRSSKATTSAVCASSCRTMVPGSEGGASACAANRCSGTRPTSPASATRAGATCRRALRSTCSLAPTTTSTKVSGTGAGTERRCSSTACPTSRDGGFATHGE